MSIDRLEWRRGWRAVFCGFVGSTLTTLQAGVLGLVIVPLGQVFGWSRGEVSASMFILCSGVLVLSPVLQPLINRVGLRRVVMSGVMLYAAAIAAVASSGPSIMSWYAAWALVAIAFPSVGAIVWTFNVGAWFDKNRGLALGAALSGIGIAAVLGPLVGSRLIEDYSWRAAYWAIAFFAVAIALPASYFLLEEPTGATARKGRGGPPSPPKEASLWKIAATSEFQLLAISMAAGAVGFGAIFVHFQPILMDSGMGLVEVGSYAAIMGPFMLLGRIGGGFLLDRLPLALVAGTAFTLPVIATVLLLTFDGAPWQALLIACLLGLTNGAEADVLAYLVARRFGLRSYATTFGLAYGVYALFFGLAPVIAGAAFDHLGSYRPVLMVLLGPLILCAVLVTYVSSAGRQAQLLKEVLHDGRRTG